jgi:hypothetical protein
MTMVTSDCLKGVVEGRITNFGQKSDNDDLRWLKTGGKMLDTFVEGV